MDFFILFLGNAKQGKRRLQQGYSAAEGTTSLHAAGDHVQSPGGALVGLWGVVVEIAQEEPANLSPSTQGSHLQSPKAHWQSCCVMRHPRPWPQGHVERRAPPMVPVSLQPRTPGLFFLGGGWGGGCSKTSPASRDAGGGSMFPKHQLPKPQASSPLALTDLLPVGEGI